MSNSKFLKAIAVSCVAVACAFALAACSNNGSSSGTAATVNGTPIPEDDVTNYIQSIRTSSGLEEEDAWGQFLAGQGMTPASVREQIIDSLVDQELVKQGAAELGVTVDSSEVDTYVESMKANFDGDEAWNNALSEAGFTEESYRESIESSLLSQAVGSHFEEEAKATDEDVIAAASTYATYYNGSKRSSHILFKVADVNDEAAMAEARAKAQSVLDQINNGLDFAEAAKQYSEDSSAEKGGDVGWDAMSSFVEEYQNALKELNVGQVSGLVQSSYGIHIIKCTDEFNAPEEITTMEQVNAIPEDLRNNITSMAGSTAANNAYNAWLEGLKENADIKINDMPSGLPYDVDMSKYESSESAEAASGEAQEDAQAEAEASGSAESASAESSDASSSASSSSAQ